MTYRVDEFPGSCKAVKKTFSARQPNLPPVIFYGERRKQIASRHWRRTVSLIEKIPTLSDDEVINLLANARRLQTEGDEKKQAQACELIGPLEEAAAERRA